jgi:hypothetical protein
MLPVPPKSSETRAIMLLILRDSEHIQVWLDYVFAEQVDVKPGGFVAQSLVYRQTANGSSIRHCGANPQISCLVRRMRRPAMASCPAQSARS